MKFEVWRVVFLKSLLRIKKHWNGLRFSSDRRFTTCALRLDRVKCMIVPVDNHHESRFLNVL